MRLNPQAPGTRWDPPCFTHGWKKYFDKWHTETFILCSVVWSFIFKVCQYVKHRKSKVPLCLGLSQLWTRIDVKFETVLAPQVRGSTSSEPTSFHLLLETAGWCKQGMHSKDAVSAETIQKWWRQTRPQTQWERLPAWLVEVCAKVAAPWQSTVQAHLSQPHPHRWWRPPPPPPQQQEEEQRRRRREEAGF